MRTHSIMFRGWDPHIPASHTTTSDNGIGQCRVSSPKGPLSRHGVKGGSSGCGSGEPFLVVLIISVVTTSGCMSCASAKPVPRSEESLVELAGQGCPPLLRCDRGRLGQPFGLQRRLGVGPRVWWRGDRKRLARLVGGSRVGQQRDAPDQRLGCIHGRMTAAPRMSSSRQPRCRAWSTAVISGSHRRLDWRVSAWSAPMSSVSRVDRTVAKVWPVSAWAVTVGVSCG